MPATPYQQTSLAMDANFLKRLTPLLLAEAGVVAAEAGTVPSHTTRAALANRIINSPQQMAASLAPAICSMTNLAGSTVTFDFTIGATVTDATDAAIRSQISTGWNVLAGV